MVQVAHFDEWIEKLDPYVPVVQVAHFDEWIEKLDPYVPVV